MTRSAVVLAMFVAAASVAADEARTRTSARTALTKYGDAVITVRLAVKNRVVFQGRERNNSDSTLEIAGTVLTAEGLTVVSDFTSNPSGLYTPTGDGPRVDTETTDVKLLLRDGREVPARFVLRDRDLDLAFLMPQESGLQLPHLSLEKGPVPEPLDDLVFLYPMGRSLNREVAVALGRVRAVVKKPRVFVVTDFLEAFQSLGCPAFDGAGKAVGLVVLRRSPGPPMGQSGPREMLDFFSPVVLTAADVQEVAAQAIAPKVGGQ
jgi:S1-C subfamily serine protease